MLYLVVQLVIISTIIIITDSHPSHQPSVTMRTTTTRTPKCKHDRTRSARQQSSRAAAARRRTTKPATVRWSTQPAAQQGSAARARRRAAVGRRRQDGSRREASAHKKHGWTARRGEISERGENGSIDARRREQTAGTYAAINQKTDCTSSSNCRRKWQTVGSGWQWGWFKGRVGYGSYGRRDFRFMRRRFVVKVSHENILDLTWHHPDTIACQHAQKSRSHQSKNPGNPPLPAQVGFMIRTYSEYQMNYIASSW